MILNQNLNTTHPTISSINKSFLSGEIFIDDSFQRRSVWSAKNKSRLIETILIGYPMPELYFWSLPPGDDGEIIHSVVDGQQRIRAITEFISGDYELLKSHLDEKRKSEPYAGQKFNELDKVYRDIIWQYRLNVRTIPAEIEIEEIKRVFLRLNETDKALNPQEKRHAKFSGKFLQLAEELSNNDFWMKWKIFSQADVRRMSDVTFVSQLLSFARLGLRGDITPTKLNDLYDTYNESYRKRGVDKELFIETFRRIDALFSADETVAEGFKRKTHLYPLFLSVFGAARVDENAGKDLSVWVERSVPVLAAFIKAYRDNENEYNGIDLRKYRQAALEGFNKKSNREIKFETISFLFEIAEEKTLESNPA